MASNVKRMSPGAAVNPTLDLESELFHAGAITVAGIDEVGRGALAGPVTIGIAVINASCGDFPAGLRDSKLLSPLARKKLIEPTAAWVVAHSVASACAQEIDQMGIMAAMRLAWSRAMTQLPVTPSHLILDGKHNWVGEQSENQPIAITTRIKADRDCAVVAAASVLAKESRDEFMRNAHEQFPQFGWNSNVGYGSAAHIAAIQEFGPTHFHRQSWALMKGQG